MKIIIKKYHLIWEWQIKQGRKVLFGGYSRTKKDAKNDVSVVMRQNMNSATQTPNSTAP